VIVFSLSYLCLFICSVLTSDLLSLSCCLDQRYFLHWIRKRKSQWSQSVWLETSGSSGFSPQQSWLWMRNLQRAAVQPVQHWGGRTTAAEVTPTSGAISQEQESEASYELPETGRNEPDDLPSSSSPGCCCSFLFLILTFVFRTNTRWVQRSIQRPETVSTAAVSSAGITAAQLNGWVYWSSWEKQGSAGVN